MLQDLITDNKYRAGSQLVIKICWEQLVLIGGKGEEAIIFVNE
jgi:hypothetical protein